MGRQMKIREDWAFIVISEETAVCREGSRQDESFLSFKRTTSANPSFHIFFFLQPPIRGSSNIESNGGVWRNNHDHDCEHVLVREWPCRKGVLCSSPQNQVGRWGWGKCVLFFCHNLLKCQGCTYWNYVNTRRDGEQVKVDILRQSDRLLRARLSISQWRKRKPRLSCFNDVNLKGHLYTEQTLSTNDGLDNDGHGNSNEWLETRGMNALLDLFHTMICFYCPYSCDCLLSDTHSHTHTLSLSYPATHTILSVSFLHATSMIFVDGTDLTWDLSTMHAIDYLDHPGSI